MILPIKLEIEGFNSFRERQVIDFTLLGGEKLFCISGTTGSGKTSILDAITLGLYDDFTGDTTSRGNLASYVNLNCDKAYIDFTYEIDGVIYRTERVIGKKPSYNSVKIVDVATGAVIKEKAKDVWDFLGEKLVLTVSEFTQVVVLQQGKFARFLKSGATARNDMVLSLFSEYDYDAACKKFKGVADALDVKIKQLDERLTPYEGLTKESIRAFEGEVKDAEKAESESAERLESANKLLSEVVAAENELKKHAENKIKLETEMETAIKLESELKAAEGEKTALEKREAELAEQKKTAAILANERTALGYEKQTHRDVANKSALIDKKREELLDKENRFALAEARYKQNGEELNAVNNQIAALGVKGSQVEVVELKSGAEKRLEDYRESSKRLDKVNAVIDELIGKEQKQKEAVGKAKERVDALSNELNAAERNLDNAKRESAVASVCSGLKVGDLCPLCGNVITDLSAHFGDKQSGLAALEREVNDKRSALKEAELKRAAEDNGLAVITTELTREIGDRNALYDKLSSVDGKAIEEEIALYSKAIALLEKQTALQGEMRGFEAAKEIARVQLENAKKEIESLTKETAELKTRITHGNERALDARIAEIDLFINKTEAEEKEVSGLKTKIERTLSAAKEGLSRVNGVIEALTELVKNQPAKPSISSVEADERAKEALKENKAAIEALTEKRREMDKFSGDYVKKRELEDRRARVNKRYKVFYDMTKLFERSSFKRFVATEYIKEFTQNASRILFDLTGGKYSISYEESENNADFFIKDFLHGNETRRASTLSGGETFLASLAMAIALSQKLAAKSAFGFFFIDEGFGTLHERAIDTVRSVLMKLSSESLVGLVTHRSELKSGIPVIIEVEEATEERGSVCKITYNDR